MFDEDDEYEDDDDGLDFREPRRTRRQTAEDLRVARIRELRDELKDARGEVRDLRTRVDASREAHTVGSGLV